MKIVLDTNVLLISLPSKSIYRPIFDALLDGKFELVLSNEILSEYVEILERKAGAALSNNIAEMLLNLDNLNKVEVYFGWNLIYADPDDNKYVDAALAGTADFIVSNDQHFNILNSVAFPKVNIINIDQFLKMIGDIDKK